MEETEVSIPQFRSASPAQLAWRKFRRNYPAMMALVVLLAFCFAAIFAYTFIPDQTRNANRILPSFARLKPGTSICFLEVSGTEHEYSLTDWLLGTTNAQRYFPLDHAGAWKQLGDSIETVSQGGLIRRYALSGLVGSAEMSGIQPQIQEIRHTAWLGTDGQGRDMLSRLVLGARASLSVGAIAVVVSLLLGVWIGSIAGFFRGWTDRAAMWLITVIWSLPTMLVVLLITFLFGKGFAQLCLGIGLTLWVDVARMVRGEIFRIREMQYVEAARALGYRPARIILRHILPNLWSPILILSASNFAAAILVESGLSFLGMGLPVPVPSWGGMVQEGYSQMFFENTRWMAIVPGITLVVCVVSLNLVANGLRDALDPRVRS